MRTHIAVKTWLIQRNGVDIGTIRGSGNHFASATSIDQVVNGETTTLYVARVLQEQRIIEVR